MLSAIMDHCTVTFVEFKTDRSLFVLQEVETWSATTSDTFVNRNASSALTTLERFAVKLTASNKTPPKLPEGSKEWKASDVEGEVAVNTKDVVCHARLVQELAIFAVRVASGLPLIKITACGVGVAPTPGFFE